MTVRDVGAAGSRRDHVTLRLPTLATYTVPSSWREKALVFRRIDGRVSFFDLYRGGPALRPCRLPLRLSKKFPAGGRPKMPGRGGSTVERPSSPNRR